MHHASIIAQFGSLIASCIKIMAQSCAPWLNAVDPWLIAWHASDNSMAQCCASGISMAQCCVSGISMAVHHAAIWLDAVHQRLTDVHQPSVWFNAVCRASIWLNAVNQACYGTIWLNAVQALIYVLMMCIRHHNAVQTVHYVSVSLDAVHPWLELCIMHEYGSIQHHTLSTFFFATLFAINTWRKEKKRRWWKSRFA